MDNISCVKIMYSKHMQCWVGWGGIHHADENDLRYTFLIFNVKNTPNSKMNYGQNFEPGSKFFVPLAFAMC